MNIQMKSKELFLGLIAGLLSFLMMACRDNKLSSHDGVIALQPLNGYSKDHIAQLKSELAHFYHKNIIVLSDRKIPDEYRNFDKGKRYDASRIIRWLSVTTGDSIIAVVGFTSEDIYTSKLDPQGNIKKPESTYAVWGIFGLGFCPGKSCVVSDRRLLSPDKEKSSRRLRTVTIHEIGHNLGLPHCPHTGCIMSDANESIATVDQSGKDYCNDCNRKIGRKMSVITPK
jgi:archaemetzincin